MKCNGERRVMADYSRRDAQPTDFPANGWLGTTWTAAPHPLRLVAETHNQDAREHFACYGCWGGWGASLLGK
jgi:hypothetical protein